MVQQLAKTASEARADDKRQMDEARADLHKVIGRIDGIIVRAQSTGHQRKRELWMMAAAFLAGILLWSFSPGMVAGSPPESWHAAQWMAARTFGTDQATSDDQVVDHGQTPKKQD
ncbi:hypothetical protein ACX40Y_17905 [Sphingomonas sp. RS6]